MYISNIIKEKFFKKHKDKEVYYKINEEIEEIEDDEDDNMFSDLENDLLNYVNKNSRDDSLVYQKKMKEIESNSFPIETNLNKYYEIDKNVENNNLNNIISPYSSLQSNYFQLT